MSLPNTSAPKIWTKDELEKEAQIALEQFVDRRLAEPDGTYAAHVKTHRKAILRLFKELAGVDLKNPDPKAIRKIILDKELFAALRYVSGPPVSEDDLGVIVTRDIAGVNKTKVKQSEELPVDILKLICSMTDPYRFPWIAAARKPSTRELREAVQSTTTLHATQSLQTERRGYGKQVERSLEKRLTELDFKKVRTPNKGTITAPIHYPDYPDFYGECTVHGRKVDLFIALPTGRMVALEAKDSSSALNSVKRLSNDTAAKAKHFATEDGKNIIDVALLSGVFKIKTLVSRKIPACI